jgi:hypothetical protein
VSRKLQAFSAFLTVAAGVATAQSRTDVPAHAFDVILGKPAQTSLTFSVLAYENLEGYIEYGLGRDSYTARTSLVRLPEGSPVEFRVDSLRPDSRYYYRLRYRAFGDPQPFWEADDATFRTPRKPGSAFRFTVQADSLLSENTSAEVYARTLGNAAVSHPDFHIELGRAFPADQRAALPQYLAQRYYFGSLCRSSYLFLASAPDKYFPNPHTDGFYSWEWGDALFIVLDPVAALTDARFAALKKTLEDSPAPLRFVFSHRRPRGRDHDLMVRTHVNYVFYGHDHVFARQEVDGVIYQSVPQPGNPRAASGHLAVRVNGREARVDYIATDDKPLSRSARSNFP